MFWELLVQAAHGQTEEIREGSRQQSRAIRDWKKAIEVAAQFRLYARWHYAVILEAARCPGFVADPQWVCTALLPHITPAEAEEALDTLLGLGLLVQTDDGIQATDDNQAFQPALGAEQLNAAAAALHRETLGHAGEALETVPTHERYFSSLTFALSTKHLEELFETLRSTQLQAVQTATETGVHDRVYQVSIQAFPRTKTLGDDS